MRRRSPALAALLVLALTAGAACSGGGDDDPAERARSEASTTTTLEELEPPAVELLDAGAEPRQELRLAPPDGCVSRTTQDQDLEQQIDVGRGPQSTSNRVQFDLTSRCTSVADDRIEFTSTYDDVRVVGAPERAPDLLEALVGLSLTTTVDRRGNVVRVVVPPLDDDVPGLTPQALEGLGEELHQTAMPFPEEAVGVGARWRVTSERRTNGIPSTAVNEFRLLSIDGSRVEAEIRSTLTFTKGPFQLETPQGPTGAEVLSGQLDGSGRVVWDLERVTTTSDQTVAGTSVMALTGPTRTEVEQTQRQHIVTTER